MFLSRHSDSADQDNIGYPSLTANIELPPELPEHLSNTERASDTAYRHSLLVRCPPGRSRDRGEPEIAKNE